MQRLLIDVHALARRWWDPERGLLTNPAGRHDDAVRPAGEVELVAPTLWWAHGLLTRRHEGDEALAHDAIRSVLTHLSHDIDAAVAMALLTRDHELPQPLERDLRAAVQYVVRCHPHVAVTTTHLAVHLAWLELDVGVWSADEALVARGLERVRAIARDTRDRGHVAEHISPTDTGMTLLGLSLWAARPPVPDVAQLGAALRDEVWQTLLAAWHPGLRTLVPPFTRTHGMDLRAHVAAVAPWLIWLVDGAYPLPPLTDDQLHQGRDLPIAFLVDALAGAGEDVLELAPLVRAQPARQGAWFDEVGERRWTGWTGESIAVGAEASSEDRGGAWQVPTAAAVWHQAADHNAWLRLHQACGPVDACVTQADGRVQLVHHVRDGTLRLLLGGAAPTAVTASLIEHGGRTWMLEGVRAVHPTQDRTAPDVIAEWVLDVEGDTVTCVTVDR